MTGAHEVDADGREAPSAFARKLGVTMADLDQILPAVGMALTALGLEGDQFVDRLREGQSFSEALALPAALTDLLYARAHNWFNVGRFDKAEALFRTLCIIDGARRDHWLGYGICLAARGHAEASDIALRIAAEIDPRSALVHYHLLDLTMRRGDWRQAAEHLAAFDQRSGDRPGSITSEVERYRRVLEVRGVIGQAADAS